MNAVDTSALTFDDLLDREWLATNGIGGYASSTVASLNTRKYHGLLVAAMTPPVRRMVLLSRVEETVHRRGASFPLASNEYPGTVHPRGYEFLRAFSHHPHPRWAYQGDGWTIEKSLRLLHGRNTVVVTYTLLAGDDSLELELRPLLAMRGIHELMYQWNGRLVAENKSRQSHRIAPTTRTPEVFFAHDGKFDPQSLWYLNTIYRREQERGYSGLEDLWNPGVIYWTMSPGQSVNFVCSTDPIDLPQALADADIETAAAIAPPRDLPLPGSMPIEMLVRAADQFVVSTATDGSSSRQTAVVSQYPWGSASGRDALIAFAGLFLVTGKFDQAKDLLLNLSEQIDRGLIPTEFPEDGAAPKYNGADTSLWFVDALHRYFHYTADEATVRRLWLDVDRIIDAYQHGTATLGITIDGNGLIASRTTGAATSWMNAKTGDWVVTPRTGCTVDLNALWYNGLRIAAMLAARFGTHARADELSALAAKVAAAFNRTFWNEKSNCCFDAIDEITSTPDASIRPNQLLAMSLPFPVLALDRHAAAIETIRAALLTPMGLRTLAGDDASYHGRYFGSDVARDRAYHQGSAYPWLLGPMVTATLRVKGRSAAAREEVGQLLDPCIKHLMNGGLGQLAELTDGDAPHRPGGALASARSIGEILRTYVEDILDIAPRVQTRPTSKPVDEIVIQPLNT